MATVVDAKRTWQDVIQEKRRVRAESVKPFTPGHGDGPTIDLNATRLTFEEFASMGGDELVASLTGHQFSCEDLVTLCIKKACEVHHLATLSAIHLQTNCLTETCFEDALVVAKHLDEHLQTQNTTMGPLHGIPTTLKDQFNIKGHDTTLGYVSRALSPAQDDAVLVKMLRSLGAVILAKSNLPQSIMWSETENPLWGLTTAPFDPRYTPGGSTGGEAVLIAQGASKLGFGTDLGGSVRIPSHMMGIYGLKPSSARLPYEGVPVSTEGQEHVPSSIGPMASTLDTLHLAMRSLIDLKPWEHDARCVPIPWREHAYSDALSRPLVFGVLRDDGVARPHPPLARVLRQAIDGLRAAGHAVVEWDAADGQQLHADCVRLMDEYYTADGGEDIRTAVATGGEPMIPHVAGLVGRGKPISVYEYWRLNRRKWALQNAYLRRWEDAALHVGGRDGGERVPVDAVLMPPMPHVAVPHGRTRWVGYTKVWNLLDYTALVMPAGNVCEEDVGAPWDFEPRGEVDEWSLRLWEEEKHDMARLKLPVGLQIVGRKLEEEKVLAIGKVVDDILH